MAKENQSPGNVKGNIENAKENQSPGNVKELVFLRSATHAPFYLSYKKGDVGEVESGKAAKCIAAGLAVDKKTFTEEEK